MTTALLLADLNVIKPDPGLILWTSVIFIVVYFLLSRFAFRPIQEALKRRELDIQNSLDEARRARQEMSHLKSENEALLRQAQEERAKILREAKEARESILTEARVKAKEDAQKIVADAKQQIDHMRQEAVIDLKNQVGNMAIEIAEKVIREKLKGDAAQEQFVNKMVEELKLS